MRRSEWLIDWIVQDEEKWVINRFECVGWGEVDPGESWYPVWPWVGEYHRQSAEPDTWGENTKAAVLKKLDFLKKGQVWRELKRIYEQCFGQFSGLIRLRIRIRNLESRILKR